MAYDIGTLSPTLLAALARHGEGGGSAYVRRGGTTTTTSTEGVDRERRLAAQANAENALRQQQIGVSRDKLAFDQSKEASDLQRQGAKDALDYGLKAAGVRLDQAKTAADVLKTMQDAVKYALTPNANTGKTPFGDAYTPAAGFQNLKALTSKAYQILDQIGATPQDRQELDRLAGSAGVTGAPGQSASTPPPRAGQATQPSEAAKPGVDRGQGQPQGQDEATIRDMYRTVGPEGMRQLPQGVQAVSADPPIVQGPDGSMYVWAGGRWVLNRPGTEHPDTGPIGGAPGQAPGVSRGGAGRVGDSTLDSEVERLAVPSVPR